MSWLEPDFGRNWPTTQAIAESLAGLKLSDVSLTLPADVEHLQSRLRDRYINGSVLGLQCRVSTDTTIDYFMSRNDPCKPGLVDRVIALLGEAGIDDELFGGSRETVELEEVSPLALDGEFAQQLVLGGAYSGDSYDQTEAKQAGRAAAESLIQNRYAEFLVGRSYSCWTSWFHGAAWDTTWFILDKAERRLTLLCSTDTD